MRCRHGSRPKPASPTTNRHSISPSPRAIRNPTRSMRHWYAAIRCWDHRIFSPSTSIRWARENLRRYFASTRLVPLVMACSTRIRRTRIFLPILNSRYAPPAARKGGRLKCASRFRHCVIPTHPPRHGASRSFAAFRAANSIALRMRASRAIQIVFFVMRKRWMA